MSPREFTDAETWAGRPVARKVLDVAPRSRVVMTGVLVSTKTITIHDAPSYICTLDDGTGQIELLFLGRRTVAGMEAGATCTVEGTARMEGGRLVVWNPLYRVEPPDY